MRTITGCVALLSASMVCSSAVAQGFPPVVNSLLLIDHVNTPIHGTVTATNDPTSWGPAAADFTLASYTPLFGAPPNSPGLVHPASWDPSTQFFSWNPAGSSLGDYVWNVSATNAFGTGLGTITVNREFIDEPNMPEPNSFILASVAFAGLVALVRRRH
jgi:hypothetical protein